MREIKQKGLKKRVMTKRVQKEQMTISWRRRKLTLRLTMEERQMKYLKKRMNQKEKNSKTQRRNQRSNKRNKKKSKLNKIKIIKCTKWTK